MIGNGVAKSKWQAYIAAEMRTPVLLLLATLTVAAGACGKRRAGGKPVVGVTLPTEDSAFHADVKRGMQLAADSLWIELLFTAGEEVDTSIAFTADLATENREGGRLLGAYVGRRLGGGGNVVILHQPTMGGARNRVAGFREALIAFPNIRIVASPAVDGRLRDVAKQRMDNLLATGQKIDAVFGTDDECALGALAAIQAAGTSGTIVVGYGATAEARAAINHGTALVADATLDAVTVGRRAIEAVAARLRGEPMPPAASVPVRLVERDSLARR